MNSIWSAATTAVSPFNSDNGSFSPVGRSPRLQQSGDPTRLSSHPAEVGRQVSGQAATASSAGSAGGITSTDFLTLLVTEMKNQDPTAQTDPNQYINQLVQINSLQQLISINQDLATALGGSSTSHNTPAPSSPAGVPRAPATSGSSPAPQAADGPSRHLSAPTHTHTSAAQSGNLTVPSMLPAAQTVAHALDGTRHSPGRGPNVYDLKAR